MPKIIAFFADGTWNGTDVDKDGDGIREDTNVLKLYRQLAGTETVESKKELERVHTDAAGNVLQVAKYLHGVGDSRNVINKLVGGAFGSGVVSRIVRGYTFISRNYEPGDKIIIVGFSRGAYTARALGGMIAKAGLMDYSKFKSDMSKREAYEIGLYVWAYYRQQRQTDLALPEVRDTWVDVYERGAPVSKNELIPNVPIHAIGVWDTVGALGIPIYGKDEQPMDLFRFADVELSPLVKRGFHALAIDEHRGIFAPTPWTDRNGIEQVWFAGAHSDVGGGYDEPELSDFALAWMANRLALNGDGLIYKEPAMAWPAGKFDAGIHDSWNRLPYKLKSRFDRQVPAGAGLHVSVNQRRGAAALAYVPNGLAGWAGQYVE